jgi:hypothetical protein
MHVSFVTKLIGNLTRLEKNQIASHFYYIVNYTHIKFINLACFRIDRRRADLLIETLVGDQKCRFYNNVKQCLCDLRTPLCHFPETPL